MPASRETALPPTCPVARTAVCPVASRYETMVPPAAALGEAEQPSAIAPPHPDATVPESQCSTATKGLLGRRECRQDPPLRNLNQLSREPFCRSSCQSSVPTSKIGGGGGSHREQPKRCPNKVRSAGTAEAALAGKRIVGRTRPFVSIRQRSRAPPIHQFAERNAALYQELGHDPRPDDSILVGASVFGPWIPGERHSGAAQYLYLDAHVAS